MYYDERENNFNTADQFYKVDETDLYYNEENNLNTVDFNNLIINNYRTEKLASLSDGFNKGNMFESSYVPYKNHMYKVYVRGERDSMLLKIQQLTFAIKDLNLYLDVNPRDTNMLNVFNKYVLELDSLKKDYQKKYGPLSVATPTSNTNFEWVKNPWPWMNEGGKNV